MGSHPDRRGRSLVRACLRRNAPGPFQLQAAINAVHTDAKTAAATGWWQVLALYDQLYAVSPTPVVGLNRTVAPAEVEGAGAGLASLATLSGVEGRERYHPFHATQAELLRQVGRDDEAAAAYDRALELATNPAEGAHLTARRESLRP